MNGNRYYLLTGAAGFLSSNICRVRNNVFGDSEAQRELGYTTRPYQETILDEVQWLIEV